MAMNPIEEQVPGGVPIKMWTRGVPVEDAAKRQLINAARLPVVFKHVAAMPDVHYGIGATVGSVIPTKGAIEAAQVEAFNERAQELADDAGVHVATGWRDAADDTEGGDPDPELVTSDGIHETEAGAEVIADVMASTVEEECSGVG